MDLAAKINERFLTCHLCWRLYNEPKCLGCLHTFCKKCIESHMSAQRSFRYTEIKEISCPICRKKTSIPSGGVNRLPDNFVLSGLREMIVDKVAQASTPYCHFCRSSVDLSVKDNSQTNDSSSICSSTSTVISKASLKCIECQKPICDRCAQEHQNLPISSNHNFYELELEKDVLCTAHPSDPVRYFCETCDECVCIICACSPEHKDHQISNFKAVINVRREELAIKLHSCQRKLDGVKRQLNAIDSYESTVNRVRDEIRSHCSELKKIIDIEEQRCLESGKRSTRIGWVNNVFEVELNSMLEKRPQLQELNDNIENTCSLVDLMLNGREIELLLMLKRLSDKMTSIMNVQLALMEEGEDDDVLSNGKCGKLKFKPGSLEFGQVFFEEEPEQKVRTFAESSTQTDECIVLDTVYNNQDHISKDQEEEMETRSEQDSESRSMSPASVIETYREATNILPRLTRKVRRILKRNCCLAVLPNSDIIVLDPDTNSLSILDKRGKIKYFVFDQNNSNDRAIANGGSINDPTQIGVGSFREISISDATEKMVRLRTPQGNLVIKLDNEVTNTLPIGFTVHAYNSMSSSAAQAMGPNQNTDNGSNNTFNRTKNRFEPFQN